MHRWMSWVVTILNNYFLHLPRTIQRSTRASSLTQQLATVWTNEPNILKPKLEKYVQGDEATGTED